MMEPHAIIGILLLVFGFFQAPLGYLHHKGYVNTGGRTFFSYLHLAIGRLFIPIGIFNGILGVELSGGEVWKQLVIGFVGGSLWLLYMVAIVIGEWRRAKKLQLSRKLSANRFQGSTAKIYPVSYHAPRERPLYEGTRSHGYVR